MTDTTIIKIILTTLIITTWLGIVIILIKRWRTKHQSLDHFKKISPDIFIVNPRVRNCLHLLDLKLNSKRRVWISSSRLGQIWVDNRIKREKVSRKFGYPVNQIFFLDEIILEFGLDNQEVHLLSTGRKSLREILLTRKLENKNCLDL